MSVRLWQGTRGSLAAGLIVTRATAESNLGREFMGQLFFSEKRTLLVTGCFLSVLMLTAIGGSGLPWVQLLFFSGSLFLIYYLLGQKEKTKAEDEKR